jgi:hypothetical protein
MAGYTRQSTGSIINGSPITAPPLNSEFNQVAAAFNATSGHSHDGSTGNSPKINLTTSVSGYLPAVHGGIGGKNKLDATTTPIVTNDNSEGYAPGSLWENTTTGRVYICVGNSTGAAVWRELVQVNSGTAILPATTDTVDLGDNSNRFQDLFLSGGISASGNVAAGGTLNITGATALGSTLGVTGDTTLVNLAATGTTTITSIDLNSGAIDSTTIGTTTPAAGTFTTLNANTSLVAATADINGGTVDGATIGASTPSTGAFTTLGASGQATLATVDINGGNIDGTAIGAAVQSTGAFTTVSTSGQATLATVDINGGSIDGASIGANTTSSGAFTTLSASGGITGALTGNVTGNVTGNLSGGNVTGNVTGNLTGNVTSTGSSSFNNVTIDGTLNMNAGTSATIQNLTAPTNDLDAATKKYVDDEISTLIGDAGAGLNTLGELADALNDDDDFSTTVTNSIATKLPKAGGTMTGAIAMSTNKITGVGDPTSAQDVATKVYTDTQRDTRVAKTGDTMSGALAMGSNKITGLGTPTAGTDATTKTYVDGILGSATVAATSASNAATSESNAATSETNASNSATAAASSSASAAASLDSFDDRYLGAKSSAPTVDNDGDALIVGSLYFDSTAGAMKVYSANGWTNAGSSVNGTTNRYSYTATAGQTVFAATYDAGYVDVFLNGVKQLVGTDVTATSGTSVVFASGTTVNDIVEIVGYGTFVLADHLTQTQSDARYVNLSGDTMTGDLSFGDSDKAIFGAGSDLSIYHDGTRNYIDSDTTELRLQTSELRMVNSANTEIGLKAVEDGAVTLYYDANPKLATTTTGVDVTGALTSNKVTIDNGLADGGELLLASQGYNSWQLDNSAGSVRFIYDGKVPYQINGASDAFIWGSSTSAATEHMRLQSGNLLVGKTSPTIASTGVELRPNGQLFATQSGSYPLLLNRTTSDGEIVQFRKDNTTVGSIGSEGSGGTFFLGSGDVTLGFNAASDIIFPRGTNAANRTDAISLGNTNNRFKDLYLSGGIFLGGAGSANKMEDYEFGFFEPTYTSTGTNPSGVTYDPTVGNEGRYTKIGGLVHIQINMRTDAISNKGSGNVIVSGLPFASGQYSSQGGYSVFTCEGDGFLSNQPTAAIIAENVTDIGIYYRSSSDGGLIALPTSSMNTGSNDNIIRISGTYMTEL